MTLPNGDVLSLYISQDALDHSVHSSKGIECEACHNDITEYPHPELKYQSPRELSRAFYQTCEKCHSANYEKALDSMHAKAAEAATWTRRFARTVMARTMSVRRTNPAPYF